MSSADGGLTGLAASWDGLLLHDCGGVAASTTMPGGAAQPSPSYRGRSVTEPGVINRGFQHSYIIWESSTRLLPLQAALQSINEEAAAT